MPAEPTHHQAERPRSYPNPAAPTVDPAPILAASNVEKSKPVPSRLPATKKSEACLTDLETNKPKLTSNAE